MRRRIYSYRKGEKMSTTNEQKVYEILDLLGIKYTKYEHNPIYTVE
jgi:Ala-tRNA(Pro) deacylase